MKSSEVIKAVRQYLESLDDEEILTQERERRMELARIEKTRSWPENYNVLTDAYLIFRLEAEGRGLIDAPTEFNIH
jgi:hypothetical protein